MQRPATLRFDCTKGCEHRSQEPWCVVISGGSVCRPCIRSLAGFTAPPPDQVLAHAKDNYKEQTDYKFEDDRLSDWILRHPLSSLSQSHLRVDIEDELFSLDDESLILRILLAQ